MTRDHCPSLQGDTLVSTYDHRGHMVSKRITDANGNVSEYISEDGEIVAHAPPSCRHPCNEDAQNSHVSLPDVTSELNKVKIELLRKQIQVPE